VDVATRTSAAPFIFCHCTSASVFVMNVQLCALLQPPQGMKRTEGGEGGGGAGVTRNPNQNQNQMQLTPWYNCR